MTTFQIQCLLLFYSKDIEGCNPGTPDGIAGQNTRSAVKAFQARVGLTADGLAGPATQTALAQYINTPLPEKAAETGQEATTGGSKTDDGAPAWWSEIKHFKRAEMRCPCGECNGFPVEPQEKLMRILDTDIWDYFKAPITIIPLPPNNPHAGGSGVRCQKYNDSLRGSVPNSRHVQGKAADIIVRGFSGSAVNAYCQSLVKAGKLRYAYVIGGGNSVHVDIL